MAATITTITRMQHIFFFADDWGCEEERCQTTDLILLCLLELTDTRLHLLVC